MSDKFRLTLAAALAIPLFGCVTASPPPPLHADPHTVALRRFGEIDHRIVEQSRRIDRNVNHGVYPPPRGGWLHQRVNAIRQEAYDMASLHAGGLTPDEQRALDQELDQTSREIGP